MTIDWSQPELVYLKNQLAVGRVGLFAGAGFSLGARNRAGDPLPLGAKLAELLTAKAGMAFHGESLPMVFEAVEPTIGTRNLWSYLSDLYTAVDIDDWYRLATSLTWFRIYTTNIDNLFQHLSPFASGQRLDTFVRRDHPEERDPHFEKLQCVHLHGHIAYRSNGLTFTLPDFASHTAHLDPWYQSLVDDLHSSPFLFIGTSLEEPILSHYLELRDSKPRDAGREYRPKSFVITPHISPIRAASLKQRNIFPIVATAEEFFVSLDDQLGVSDFKVTQVQGNVWPHLFSAGVKVRSDVASDFDPVIADCLPQVNVSSAGNLFLGSEPTWDDIRNKRDADRQINTDLIQQIENIDTGFKCIVLHGPAGCGKTTTLMRAATRLSQAGHQVYFARGIERLSLDGVLSLASTVEKDKKRIVVIIDVASRHMGAINARQTALLDQTNLTLLLADRTNRYASRCQQLAELEPLEVAMPDLAAHDVDAILDRLTEFGFLGVLRNKTREEQIHEFMVRAKRQLLVAMREATSGKDFDAILEGEFNELIPEARLAYTICCIAVAKGAPGVYRKHLTPCIPRARFTKGVVIDDLLRGVLVPGNETGTLLKPRHGVIAQLVANEIAPTTLKYDAVTAFLAQVSSYIVPNEIRKRTPPFLAYRGMVNSEGLFELFAGDTGAMLSVYDEVRPYFDGDFLFWLQYAMAHIKAGNLDTAENFLNQSLNIRKAEWNHQAQHQKGILYLLQAVAANNPVAMKGRAEEGMEILRQQMWERGDHDSYPYHAYLTHVGRWYTHAGDMIGQEEWESLRNVANEACRKYRLDDTIRDVAKEVEGRYLRRLIRKSDGSGTSTDIADTT